jgi:hypothetical protein
MRRRTLLASALPALAGCSLAPSGPSTAEYPASGPNIFASFDWDADRSVLVTTFDRGNRITAANTSRLAVVTTGSEGRETVWVDRAGDAEPAAEFPLVPGATLRHEVTEPAATRLVWEAPVGHASRAVAVWDPETEDAGDDA